MIYKNILETIGHTPLLQIEKNIFAKFEGTNPTGSIKDRVAIKMITAAEKSGELKPGKTIIEATSGNTGISLAMIGAVLNYQVEIVMSSAVSIERQKMIRAFGAKIILTDENNGTDGAIRKVKELTTKFPEKYFCTDQFSNKQNYLAHYETTGPEIFEEMNVANLSIDFFTAALGTSGTLMGTAKFLKKQNPNIKIFAAEPTLGHYIQGLKNMSEAIIPAIYDENFLDGKIAIETEMAFAAARELIHQKGIFVGMSSGAAFLAAKKLAKQNPEKNIVTIFPDRGEKYLSTKLLMEG